jgi:hypothetical protein
MHSSMILKTIEVKSMGILVSSSMDRSSLPSTFALVCCHLSLLNRSLIVWPSSLLNKYDTPDFEEFRQEFESVPLTGWRSPDLTLSLPLEPFPSSWSIGQIHAIRSLAYAPHNELILGAGFDYDVSRLIFLYFPSSLLHRSMLGIPQRKHYK